MNKTVDHASRSHALLSASSASRWLQCPPSARQEELLPDTTSSFAKEGTVAHEVCDILLKKELKLIVSGTATRNLNKLKKDELYSSEMLDNANDYVGYVVEKIKSDEATVLIEEKLDFSAYVPEGFGTGDCIIIQDNVLTIIDYKYGKGVRVEAEYNPQMMLYALGAIDMFGYVYDFDMVEMCIYQPRIDNISEFTMTVADLLDWGNEKVVPVAKLAFNGDGEYKPGDHCRFCKIRNKCAHLAEYCMETVASKFEDETGKLDHDLLTADDIAMIVGRIKTVQSWLRDVENYAINGILDKEFTVPGYKVVEGRSNRVYSDPDKVADTLVDNGYPESTIYEKKLLGITAMEKAVGKKKFNEIVGALITKPKGKPTLAPITDKRPEYKKEEILFDDESEEN